MGESKATIGKFHLTAYIWYYHVSWAFEARWAYWLDYSDNEKERLSGTTHEPPPDFEPDRVLSTIGRWHPLDQLNRPK